MASPATQPYAVVRPSRLATTVLGHTLDELVHSGALASVYRAHGPVGTVAVKLYEPGLVAAELGRRIAREHNTQLSVAHPNVARLVDAGGLPDGAMALVSEWVDGELLEARLARGPIPWSQLRPILLGLARGLAAIHAAKIVHRDLKPANVVLRRGSDHAVILDFGHALLTTGGRLTTNGRVFGSPAYMAPEQCVGADLDGRADLYALGVITYRALTGVLPHEGTSIADVLRQHRDGVVVPPRRRVAELDVPAAADDLCMWMLAKTPASRLPSANVLGATVQAIEKERP